MPHRHAGKEEMAVREKIENKQEYVYIHGEVRLPSTGLKR